MGFSFPAGSELEKTAFTFKGDVPGIKVCVNGFNCNLSDLRIKLKQLYVKTNDKTVVSAYVFEFVSETLFKMSENLRNKYPDIPIVYAGGVMSSQIIREKLSMFHGRHAEAQFSSDNAAGCALLCREKFMRLYNQGENNEL